MAAPSSENKSSRGVAFDTAPYPVSEELDVKPNYVPIAAISAKKPVSTEHEAAMDALADMKPTSDKAVTDALAKAEKLAVEAAMLMQQAEQAKAAALAAQRDAETKARTAHYEGTIDGQDGDEGAEDNEGYVDEDHEEGEADEDEEVSRCRSIVRVIGGR